MVAFLIDCFAQNPEEIVKGDTVRAGMTDDEIIDYILEFDPQLVGVSQMFSYLEPVCKSIFKLIKKINPKIKIESMNCCQLWQV